jgi:hypothetical protein
MQAPATGPAAASGVEAPGAPSSVGRPPPAFDIQADASEEDVATMLMDPTDLSAEIERALQVASQPGATPPALPQAPAVHAPAAQFPAAQFPGGQSPGGHAPTPGAAPLGAPAGSLAPSMSRAPMAPDLSLEELLANQPADDSGLRRALIVAIVLFVIVATAVALLWMGQEGMLG